MPINANDVLAAFDGTTPLKPSAITDLDKTFEEYGLDSLDIANFLLAIEEKFGVAFPEEEIDQVNSINKLVKYLNR